MSFTRGLSGFLLTASILLAFHSASASTPSTNAYPSASVAHKLVSPSTLVKSGEKTQPSETAKNPGVLERAYRRFMEWSSDLAGAPGKGTPFERKNIKPSKPTLIEKGADKALDAASGLAGNDRSGDKTKKSEARRTIKTRIDKMTTAPKTPSAPLAPVVSPATPPGDLGGYQPAPENRGATSNSFLIDPLTTKEPAAPLAPIYTPEPVAQPQAPRPPEPIGIAPDRAERAPTPSGTASLLEPIISEVPEAPPAPLAKDGDVIAILPAPQPAAAATGTSATQAAPIIVPPGEINPRTRANAAWDSHPPAFQDVSKPYDEDAAFTTPAIGSPRRDKPLPPLVGKY